MELSDDMVANLEAFLQNDIDGKLRQRIITSLAALQQRMTEQAQKLQSPPRLQDHQCDDRSCTERDAGHDDDRR